MNINAAFPGTYLKAGDLQGRRVTVTMSHVNIEELGGEHKPVLYFEGKERGLVLNKTNANIIAELHGPETDDWVGHKITIYPARVEFQGKIVDAIRVDLNAAAAASQAPLAAQRPTAQAAPAQQARPMQKPVMHNGANGAHDPHPASLEDSIPF